MKVADLSSSSKESDMLSEKLRMSPEKTKEMQERNKERNSIVQAMKNRGSSTVQELSNATGIEKPRVLKHLIAMRAFGKAQIVGDKDDEIVYSLIKED
jgi:predicted HTH transcriptional regulator